LKLSEVEERYGISSDVSEVLKNQGIEELYPPQVEALEKGVLEGKNLVLAIPTAAGKTLVSELAMLKSILDEGGMCVYIVPLRALASEKYEDFKEKYEPLGIDVGIATGDYDVDGSNVSKHDILIATSEKIDSLLRNEAKWLADMSTVVVFDEIHLIDDQGRGPTQEILAARLKQLNPDIQILGLSATISNSGSIADWLDAEHLKSDWRPVPLKEGVYHNDRIVFGDRSEKDISISSNNKVSKLVVDTIENEDGQALVFVSTRRSTQAEARRVSKEVGKLLDPDEKEELEEYAEEIEDALGESTETCEKLAQYVRNGAAFHHAGLHHDQRGAVEEAFKKDLVKVICATPTLAAGVSLPSQRSIIRDYKRYSPPEGMKPIPVLEYKQMAGRAGRPEYDDHGEAVLVGSSEDEREVLLDEYVSAEPERIESKLSSEPAIRTHVLGSIAAGYVNSFESMLDFIDGTFFAYQSSTSMVEGTIEKVLDFLRVEDMISSEGKWLSATKYGERVSQLYIDPLSGVKLREGIESVESKNPSDIGFLQMICATPDMNTLYLKKGDKRELESMVSDYQKEDRLLLEPPEEWRYPEKFEYFLTQVKTAEMLIDWINEIPEDKIHDKYGIGAGDIRRKVSTAEWLLYAGYELSKLFKVKEAMSSLQKLRDRVKYGVKEELLDLIDIKGVGRVRARSLYDRGFDKQGLKDASLEELSKVKSVGRGTAKKIKSQIDSDR